MGRAVQLTVAAGLLLLALPPVQAGEAETAIHRHGDAYVIYLPGTLDYQEIVDRLQTEIMAQNWEVIGVSDIDEGMKQYGQRTFNKLVLACKSQYLAQALQEDPFISLIIPCRFAVFLEQPESETQPARIVVGFADPVAEATAMGISQHQAAQRATQELLGVLKALAEFYRP